MSAEDIKWKKDRGKEPMRDKERLSRGSGAGTRRRLILSGGAKFDGNRWNDLHYSNSFKRSARERRVAEVKVNA